MKSCTTCSNIIVIDNNVLLLDKNSLLHMSSVKTYSELSSYQLVVTDYSKVYVQQGYISNRCSSEFGSFSIKHGIDFEKYSFEYHGERHLQKRIYDMVIKHGKKNSISYDNFLYSFYNYIVGSINYPIEYIYLNSCHIGVDISYNFAKKPFVFYNDIIEKDKMLIFTRDNISCIFFSGSSVGVVIGFGCHTFDITGLLY